MEIELKRGFPEVRDGDGLYYGGTQNWSRHKYVRGYGCGVIACANVLLHTVDRQGSVISKDEFIKYARHLRRWYLPVIPRFGMNGLQMALGLNFYFILHKMPFFAYWGVRPSRVFTKIDGMLKKDFPVVLSAGPNFPFFWQKHRLTLYRKYGDEYRPESSMRAHYVTVTGSDDEYLTVSSWGGRYYIKKTEFREYVKKHSNCVYSSILVITER